MRSTGLTQEALDLGFKVLWSKNEGTDEVLEGTAQEYESTAGANLSTAEVYESTAHSLFKGKLSTKEDFVSFREMITSQLQGKLRLYDESSRKRLCLFVIIKLGKIVGILDLMRQNEDE
ncbi:hypothetical protein Tco_0743041 [Tanacetum coccineum]